VSPELAEFAAERGVRTSPLLVVGKLVLTV
jgi:hypothetical protein